VEIEIGYSRPGALSGGGGGTEINLANGYKSTGGAGGVGKGYRWSVHEDIEVLSYDAGHVQLSVKLKSDTPGTGKLSADLSTYSTVVNITKEKTVILNPFRDITLTLSMKDNPAAGNAPAGTPQP
jgi:hypothetical protein